MQRFSHELSNSFIRMKNFNYKGKQIRPQRIKVKQGPKIEEVLKTENGTNKDSDFLNNRNMAKEINKQINENAKTPNWNFLIISKDLIQISTMKNIMKNPANFLNRKFSLNEYEENKEGDLLFYDNNNANPKFGKGFFYFIELNLLAKSSGINLNVSDDGFVLTCGNIYKLLISFPNLVNSKDSYSYFDTKNRYLYVFLPFFEEDLNKFENKENDKKFMGKRENQENEDEAYTEIVKFDCEEILEDNGIDKGELAGGNLKKNVLEQISDDYLFDVIV